MKKEEQELIQGRKQFNKKYNKLSKSEIQKELLFTQQLTIDKLEGIRSNTSILVWFLVVIPVISGILAIIFIAFSK